MALAVALVVLGGSFADGLDRMRDVQYEAIGPDVAGDAGAGNGGARMGGCCETTGSDGHGGTSLAVFVVIVLRRRRVAVVQVFRGHT